MPFTNFPNGATSFGIPLYGTAPLDSGMYFFVNGTTGVDSNLGGSADQPFKTIQAAVNSAASQSPQGAVILVAPGTYAETVTIARPTAFIAEMYIVGAGPQGSIKIQPTTTNANAVVNNADDVTLINIKANANGTGIGCKNTGSRFQTYACKFENTDGTGTAMQLTLDSAGGSATEGGGADCQLINTEFAWAATGLLISGNNGLAVTQIKIYDCRFHNLATAHIAESTLNAGPAADAYRNLEISACVFEKNEDGTNPTKFLLLNASNSNTGIVTTSSFPVAINSGLSLVSTALLWVCNYHTGGVSTGQPS